jgi:hypothetical protein
VEFKPAARRQSLDTTIFARDADTGAAKWAYQMNPHDLWDYDEINENVLVDLDIDGQPRKVLVHIGRNGFMYVIDRQTGEVLSADPYDTVTSIKSIDLKTGRGACGKGSWTIFTASRSRCLTHCLQAPAAIMSKLCFARAKQPGLACAMM